MFCVSPCISLLFGELFYPQICQRLGDEAIKSFVIGMLGELTRLQHHAIEDKNTKARWRIVMGLREVARGIHSHKVKMVVMANNLDQYGAIDEKLQEILDLAREEDVAALEMRSVKVLKLALYR
jgi:selenocysteine insertion sequence-binding protein 2